VGRHHRNDEVRGLGETVGERREAHGVSVRHVRPLRMRCSRRPNRTR
jgi:hypothetical protein